MPPTDPQPTPPQAASPASHSQLPAVPKAGLKSSEFWLGLAAIVALFVLAYHGVIEGWVVTLGITLLSGWFTQHRAELKQYHLDTIADLLAQNAPVIAAPLRQLSTATNTKDTAQGSADRDGAVPANANPSLVANGQGGFAAPEALALVLVVAVIALLFGGCAANQPRLPRGSYAEVSGWAKDNGGRAAVGGQVLAHIPLDGGFAK